MISDKQMQIMAFPYTDYDAIIADGAIRSGKTSIMMLSFVKDAMERFNGQRFGICGKTVDSTVKNIIMPFLGLQWAREQWSIQWKRSDKLLIISGGGVVNAFEVFGGKDEASFMLIQGRTLAGVLFDEVALQPRSFVEQALARCSVDGSKFWFNCNPESPNHWFYQEWILGAEERNAYHLHFTLQDNPSLSKEIMSRYESMYSGVFYERYILGRWVAAEGLIYRIFAENSGRYIVEDVEKWQEKHKRLITITYGVDFGGTGSATKFQCTGITSDYCVIALDEVYIDHKRESIDPDALNRRYAAFVKKCSDRWGGGQTRADSAEQILIRGLFNTARSLGLHTQVKNALKMPINDRIKLTLLLMAQGRLYVTTQCPHLIEAFSTAVYDDKKDVDTRLDDGTSDIDSLDAFEYSIEPYYKQLEAAGHRS